MSRIGQCRWYIKLITDAANAAPVPYTDSLLNLEVLINRLWPDLPQMPQLNCFDHIWTIYFKLKFSRLSLKRSYRLLCKTVMGPCKDVLKLPIRKLAQPRRQLIRFKPS